MKTALILAVVLLWALFAACVFVEYWDPTRYGAYSFARHPSNEIVAVAAYLLALGLVATYWLTVASKQLAALWLSLLGAAFAFGAVGWILEQRLHHAAWHPDKEDHTIIAFGCLILALVIGSGASTLSFVLRRPFKSPNVS